MKCPLLHHKEHNPDIFPCEVFEDCLKEDCAWWDRDNQQCFISALGTIAANVQYWGKSIRDKITNEMPGRLPRHD